MLKLDKEHVAQTLEAMATLLEIQGENPFKVRAYYNAAHALYNLSEDFAQLIKGDRLTEYAAIGESLNEKIKTLALTGTHPAYEKLKKAVPAGLLEMMRVPGLGSKKIKLLYEKLKIRSLEALKAACLKGKISKLPGFGVKTEKNILSGIENLTNYSKRHLWWGARELALPLLEELRGLKGVKQAEIAGSFRRCLETIGDLDLVAASAKPAPVMQWFVSHPLVDSVIGHGEAKSSVRLVGGMQADLWIVPPEQFAFALLHATGSKSHNITLRQRAIERGWKLSEWGLLPKTSKTAAPFSAKSLVTEAKIYQALGLQDMPPELRENTGEIEAAEKGKLPRLIELQEIRGAFHVHTTASDGRAPLEAMAKEAEKLKWEYMGISDHSKIAFQANGLDEKRLMEQREQIHKLNRSKKYKVHLFAGTECDILPDGRLDFSNEVLKELDFVIISIHIALRQDEKSITKRLIRAIENPYTTIVGHLTGRLLLRREPSALNIPKVIDACIANGKIMELNACPERLDMDWRYWHKAAEKGLLCSINPDAHDRTWLRFVEAGVNIARKGWLEKRHVLNTRSLAQVKKLLEQTRRGS